MSWVLSCARHHFWGMDGWMDGQICHFMDGWMDLPFHGWMDGFAISLWWGPWASRAPVPRGLSQPGSPSLALPSAGDEENAAALQGCLH